jgi:hypothetical protein
MSHGQPVRLACVIALLSLGLCPPSARAETQDNLQYAHWAKFKPGTTVTMTGDMDAGSLKLAMEIVTKLVEVNADKLSLETTTVTTIAGQERKSPPRKREVPAKEEKKADVKTIGEEEIEAGGKKYKCKVIEGDADAAGGAAAQQAGKTKAKIWVNEQVPGGAVKMVVTTPRGNMTFTLKSFDAK